MPHMYIYTYTDVHTHTYIYTQPLYHLQVCRNDACIPLKGAKFVFSVFKTVPFGGTATILLPASSAAPSPPRTPGHLRVSRQPEHDARVLFVYTGLARTCHRAHVWLPWCHQPLQRLFSVSAWV